MDRISLGGRPVAGFAIGRLAGEPASAAATPVYAAVMTGAAAGLLAYVLRAPAWGSVVAGAGAALLTKVAIDRVGA